MHLQSRRLWLLLSAMSVSITGCVAPEDMQSAGASPLLIPPMMNTRPATYDCEDSGRVIVRPVGDDGAAIVLAFLSGEAQLKSVPADQGKKYSDGAAVFWIVGDRATLVVAPGRDPETCDRQ